MEPAITPFANDFRRRKETAKVGLSLGLSVGSLVGLSLGSLVGSLVGSSLGLSVGSLVGSLVGLLPLPLLTGMIK